MINIYTFKITNYDMTKIYDKDFNLNKPTLLEDVENKLFTIDDFLKTEKELCNSIIKIINSFDDKVIQVDHIGPYPRKLEYDGISNIYNEVHKKIQKKLSNKDYISEDELPFLLELIFRSKINCILITENIIITFPGDMNIILAIKNNKDKINEILLNTSLFYVSIPLNLEYTARIVSLDYLQTNNIYYEQYIKTEKYELEFFYDGLHLIKEVMKNKNL